MFKLMDTFMLNICLTGPIYQVFHITLRNLVVIVSSKWECSGRVLDLRPRGRGFEPHWRHCVVVLEQGTLILA